MMFHPFQLAGLLCILNVVFGIDEDYEAFEEGFDRPPTLKADDEKDLNTVIVVHPATSTPSMPRSRMFSLMAAWVAALFFLRFGMFIALNATYYIRMHFSKIKKAPNSTGNGEKNKSRGKDSGLSKFLSRFPFNPYGSDASSASGGRSSGGSFGSLAEFMTWDSEGGSYTDTSGDVSYFSGSGTDPSKSGLSSSGASSYGSSVGSPSTASSTFLGTALRSIASKALTFRSNASSAPSVAESSSSFLPSYLDFIDEEEPKTNMKRENSSRNARMRNATTPNNDRSGSRHFMLPAERKRNSTGRAISQSTSDVNNRNSVSISRSSPSKVTRRQSLESRSSNQSTSMSRSEQRNKSGGQQAGLYNPQRKQRPSQFSHQTTKKEDLGLSKWLQRQHETSENEFDGGSGNFSEIDLVSKGSQSTLIQPEIRVQRY